ncbi:MAG: putative metalloprotease CJM1_0395 family protein [Gammaproteobacteria bacterium]|nr:putative metalloprotease CJM1_0395 family protein [Gammaproteobacteria bacterium]
MNIGQVGSSFLHTTSNAQTAQGLQSTVTPVKQAETLTRINATQNTPNAENKPNSQHPETDKNADEVAAQYNRLGKNVNNYQPKDEHENSDQKNKETNTNNESRSADNPQRLSEEELEQVKEMAKRDREVRTHEQAHMATAGQYARGGINLETKTGPDGKSYAVSGHVNIDTSPVPNNPEATIQKANRIRAAAMAPAEPSSQDRSVASEATKMATDARAELAKEQNGKTKEPLKAAGDDTGSGQKEALDNTENETRASSEYRKIAGLDSSQTQQHILHHVV